MHRLVTIITGRTAAVVALLGFLLAGVVIGLLGDAQRTPSPTDGLPAGFDSTLGTELQQRLPTNDSLTAIVLFTGENGAVTGSRTALQQLISQVTPAGKGAGQPSPVIPSQDGTAAIAVLSVPSASAGQTAEQVTTLRSALTAGVPAGITARVTGPAAIQADLAAVFDGADITLLGTTAAVVALLLLLTYRSPVLWIIPLLVVGAADRMASVLATRVLAAVGVPWDESTVGILSVLVFGAGTNYALLLISRYRDELKQHAARHEAMALALRRAGEAVFASAGTVFVGLLTLLLSVIPSTRGLGLACAIGILTAAAFVLVVLPAFLVLFGRWVFWPQVPREGQPVLADTRSLWRRVGDRVAARPRTSSPAPWCSWPSAASA